MDTITIYTYTHKRLVFPLLVLLPFAVKVRISSVKAAWSVQWEGYAVGASVCVWGRGGAGVYEKQRGREIRGGGRDGEGSVAGKRENFHGLRNGMVCSVRGVTRGEVFLAFSLFLTRTRPGNTMCPKEPGTYCYPDQLIKSVFWGYPFSSG